MTKKAKESNKAKPVEDEPRGIDPLKSTAWYSKLSRDELDWEIQLAMSDREHGRSNTDGRKFPFWLDPEAPRAYFSTKRESMEVSRKHKRNTMPPATETSFWLDPKAPRASDLQLADAISKLIWKHMYVNDLRVYVELNKEGLPTRLFHCADVGKVSELLNLINTDIDAAKAFFFQPPKATPAEIRKNPSVKRKIRECEIGMKSWLIFVGVLSQDISIMKTRRLTLSAIFRQPKKKNKCFVCLVTCDSRLGLLNVTYD